MDAGFWRGRRVFITGHTGFKGSWLSLWLQHMGAITCGYALPPPTNPALFIEANISDGMKSVIGDIRDLAFLTASMQEFLPEIVIHMAAQPLVLLSYNDPILTYETNVMGTVNVFEAARKTPSVNSIVNVTTDKCYENKEWVWGYRETEAMGGYDPYSSSKGCSELITSAYQRSFMSQSKISLASARAGNVIGGGDWADNRLIPDILRGFESDSTVTIRKPNSIRPWQHVLEPLAGYLLLAQKLHEDGEKYVSSWNFGPADADSKSVLSIVQKMTEFWGDGATWQVENHGANPHEANYLKLDCSKSNSILGWQPKWSLDQALLRIIKWHRFWESHSMNMRDYCLNEVDDYLNGRVLGA